MPAKRQYCRSRNTPEKTRTCTRKRAWRAVTPIACTAATRAGWTLAQGGDPVAFMPAGPRPVGGRTHRRGAQIRPRCSTGSRSGLDPPGARPGSAGSAARCPRAARDRRPRSRCGRPESGRCRRSTAGRAPAPAHDLLRVAVGPAIAVGPVAIAILEERLVLALQVAVEHHAADLGPLVLLPAAGLLGPVGLVERGVVRQFADPADGRTTGTSSCVATWLGATAPPQSGHAAGSRASCDSSTRRGRGRWARRPYAAPARRPVP